MHLYINVRNTYSLIIFSAEQLSEESQKTRNKDFKNYRIRFAQKFSRVQTITNVFNKFLLTSEPYITYLSHVCHCQKIQKSIPNNIKRLFVESEIEKENQSKEENEEDIKDESEDKDEAED